MWREHPEVAKQPIRQWQIWNEPNLTRYWNVAPWAPSYVKLLKAADKALKAADPRLADGARRPAERELGGDATRSTTRARAASFDVVTLHPYTGKPKNVVRIVKIVRRVMADRKDGKLPIWVTELSWPAARGQDQAGGRLRDHRRRAGAAARGGPEAARRRSARALRIERVYWYTWLSVEGITTSAFDYSGLRRVRNGALHDAPALATFKRVAKRLQGCAKRPGNALRCR